MTTTIHRIMDTFAVLQPDLAVKPVPLSPTLYPDLDKNFNGFANHVLVSVHEFSEPWATWERHPVGDEIVMLLSGEVRMSMRIASSNQTVVLKEAGSYLIVPKDTWHTASPVLPTRLLFVTPGQGTENKSGEELGFQA